MSRPTSPRKIPPAVLTKEYRDGLEQEARNELDSIGFCEILDQDSRPTAIFEIDSDYLNYGDTKNGLRPIFCNTALRLHDRLLDSVISGDGDDAASTPTSTTYHEFRSWVTSVTEFDDSRDVFPLTFLYRDLLWTGSTVRKRWRIISGNQCYAVSHLPKGSFREGSPGYLPAVASRHKSALKPSGIAPVDPKDVRPGNTATSGVVATAQSSSLVSSEPPPLPHEHSSNATSKISSNTTTNSGASITLPRSTEHGVPDWTVAKPRGSLTEHMEFARNVDWTATPLGPMASWSVQFREIANLVMRNPHPCSLFWGEELTMLYNEAYKNEVAGNKHPDLMGTGFSGPFSELWDGVGPIFRECAQTGKSIRMENDRLPIERYGYLEETFFSWSFTPIYGGTQRILGFYNAPFETTYQTISSRRLHTLRQVGESVAEARSVKHFWRCVLGGLEDNHYDVPFAILYSIADSDDTDTASQSSDSTISMKTCVLEGSIGIPDGHPATPPKLDLKRSKEGFVPAFRDAMRTREPTMILTRNGTLPEELLEGIEWRGSGDPCREAIIVPVRPTNGENIFAFLLIGVNPRRAYDDEYKVFLNMLNRQLATSLASFLLFEEEVRRNRDAAEVATLQREKLTKQLELQANRMRRMTELSPLGMYLFDPDGALLEANERYYEMTGHARDDDSPFAFLDSIADGSRHKAAAMWDNLLINASLRQEELQLKNPKIVPVDLEGEPIEYWVLATSQTEVTDGKVRSVMGSIADISHMKWAQGLQDRRLREAEETKRQQNEFIDITSHEMRGNKSVVTKVELLELSTNPLSAILICADDIRDSLAQHTFADEDAKVVSDCIEGANNIALCVQHQKSIVDDILTVSKLDSNLLQITPIPVQPVAVVNRAMSMFKPEVQAKDIEFNFCPHHSLHELNVDWVNLDPSRLLQITVNLITNAIKFTQASSKRVISVHLGASVDQPELHVGGFDYIPIRTSVVNATAGSDWGEGQLLYIRVKVEDTGCGLTVDEKKVLFGRFAQASPRTHAHYGGSGLGLFISRQLAELHGGQIGVSSEAGVGSTFGFFIQARRTSAANSPALLGSVLPGSSQPVKSMRDENTKRAGPATSPSRTVPIPIATTNQSPIDPSDLHILIVEDNLVNQRVLSKQLRKAGSIVYTADNGLLALDHLATTSFQVSTGTKLSVILMDLEMPEMDGLTCVGRIREMEDEGTMTGHVPVIAVTANVREEQVATAISNGMDDVLKKPFRVPELLEKIGVVLERLGRR